MMPSEVRLTYAQTSMYNMKWISFFNQRSMYFNFFWRPVFFWSTPLIPCGSSKSPDRQFIIFTSTLLFSEAPLFQFFLSSNARLSKNCTTFSCRFPQTLSEKTVDAEMIVHKRGKQWIFHFYAPYFSLEY